jgi:hypothetical protein
VKIQGKIQGKISLSAFESGACINLRLYRQVSGCADNPSILRRNRDPTVSPPTLTDSHGLSFTCPTCAFGRVSTPMPVGVSEGYPQCWVPVPIQPKNDITESHFDSHLSGPRVLIYPLSPLAQLIRRALPPFRYVIRDNSSLLKNGHQGRDIPPVYEIRYELWFRADFADAGQDAFAMVTSLYSTCGET